MLRRAKTISKGARNRALVYLFSIPLVSFFYGILTPSTANADEPQPSTGGDAGNTTSSTDSTASSGGGPQASSESSTQEPLAEAATVVATAESTVTSLETKVEQIAEVA